MFSIVGVFVLTALYCASASATGSWTISEYRANAEESSVVITPTGSSLGPGGFCYTTNPPGSAYSLTNATGVSGKATWIGTRKATWNPDPNDPFGAAAFITVNLSIGLSATWESGADDNTNYSGEADAVCIGATDTFHAGDAVAVEAWDKGYNNPAIENVLYSDSGLLNPGGEIGAYTAGLKAVTFSQGVGAYSMATASAIFVFQSD